MWLFNPLDNLMYIIRPMISASEWYSKRKLFEIRLATLEDSPAIARIQVDSYRSAYAGILPADYLAQFSYDEQEQDWLDWPAAHPEDCLLVAENQDREIVGYALSRPGLTGIPPYDGELLAP